MLNASIIEFTITISSLPSNWNELLHSMYVEGIYPSELMAEKSDFGFPIPSDGSLRIEKDDVILEGAAQCGGGKHCGECTVKYPKSKIDYLMDYTLQVYNSAEGPDEISRVRALLKKHNIQFKER